MEQVAEGLRCTVIPVMVDGWEARLTPWPAPALYREEDDYAGGAAETLAWLVDEELPRRERELELSPASYAIAGYSLAGLFALYAFLHDGRFAAVGCLSGSLWYDGWLQHLCGLDVATEGRYAYLSLGSKEKRASQARLKQVEERTAACVEELRSRGLRTDFVLNPGGHLTRVGARTRDGLLALDEFLA